MTNETELSGNRDRNEKRNWFHSLSRRRKSSTSTSQKQLNNDRNVLSTAASAASTSSRDSSNGDDTSSSNPNGVKERKRKDDRKNVFQRFKKRMGIHFSMRQKKNNNCISAAETQSSKANSQYAEEVPFTHHYRRFVTKKWLNDALGPNRIMYTACSEMLGQVWYWGEISRRDAQGQLKDKPIGSFLVRDSETGGISSCWYTLSFRILNCTLHYRLEHRGNYWHFQELQYESIVEMIEDILHRCTRDNYVCYVSMPNQLQPQLAVVLKYPVSRYNNIMKLQDLCRRVIQRHVAADEIQELQIPVKLQQYLGETPELVFQSS